MNQRERNAVNKFFEYSQGRLKLLKIENMIGEATPDINGLNRNGTGFWLEAKALECWPKRPTTAPLKGAFERGQLAFGRAWRSWKGEHYVLLKVQQSWLLLDACRPLDQLTTQELIDTAVSNGLEFIVQYLEKL